MKTRECNYCGNMVEDIDYSDKSELHKGDCPIRNIMEVRLADEAEEKRKENENIITLPKGTIIKLGGFPYRLMEDTKVF